MKCPRCEKIFQIKLGTFTVTVNGSKSSGFQVLVCHECGEHAISQLKTWLQSAQSNFNT